MAKAPSSILLCIGLLSAGTASAWVREAVPVQCATVADTASALGRSAGWGNRALELCRDPRLRWQRGRDLLRVPWEEEAGGPGLGAAAAATPVADPNLWGADGNVMDIARSGNTLYIAGSFRSVGENSGGFVPVDGQTGEVLRPFPRVAGSVHVIVPDGSGGWYIGGEFTAVAGRPRSCLAQIRADGSVTDWNPSVTGSPGYIDPPAVIAIAIQGTRLFVGGGFREIGGQPHENLGCVDVWTGEALDWDLDLNVEGWVSALAVYDSAVFVAGEFTRIGGVPRSYLAAIDASTGTVTPWRADPDYTVLGLLVRGDTLYAAGKFGWIGGGLRAYLAALDVRTAQLLPFDADVRGLYVDYVPTPQVGALALVGDTLYAGGNFTQVGGMARASLVALNATTGEVLSWSPPALGPQYEGFPPPICGTLVASGGTVFIGGWFETVGAESRPFAAALSRETGAVLPWNPKPDLYVSLIVPRGDTAFVGGIFSLMGEWKHRAGLAAVDLTSGALVKRWNPNPDGSTCTAIAVNDGRVFVSGDFVNIGGDPQPRRYFAALDTVNGEVLDWNPGANSIGSAFLLAGDTLYVGGEFTQIGGQPRNYLAALNATTGELLPWDPNANWPVYALARGGNRIYVGGIFQRMGGQSRRGIAAVDAATGALQPWNPDTDNSAVEALLVNANTVYVGGGFAQIGGRIRRSLAALDGTTGAATDWNPDPTQWDIVNPRIRALALVDSTLYVGGSFATIGGQARICLAAVDTSTGLATDWDPGMDGLVWSLAACGNTLYVGGGFTRAGGLPAVGLAAFSSPEDPVPAPTAPFGLAQNIPNPARSSAIIRFSLPQAAHVTLSVFDVQGRRVASLLDHALQAAGRHDVPVQSGGWKPGVYLYRLETGGRSATRKMVVLE